MLFTSNYAEIQGLTRSIIIFLSIIGIIALFILGIITLLYMKKKEETVSKKFFIAISLLFIAFGLGRVVLLFSDFLLPDEIADELFEISWKIAYGIMMCGLVSLVYVVESQKLIDTYVYKKTKHLFTIVGIIFIFSLIILPYSILRILNYIVSFLLVLLPLIIYSIIAKKSTGDVRKKAIILIIGILIGVIGLGGLPLMNVIGIMSSADIMIISPPICLVGLTIMGYELISIVR
jgi:hypothetical protein